MSSSDLQDDLRLILRHAAGRFKGLERRHADYVVKGILRLVDEYREDPNPDHVPELKKWIRRVSRAYAALDREINSESRFGGFVRTKELAASLDKLRLDLEALRQEMMVRHRLPDYRRRQLEEGIAGYLDAEGIRVSTSPTGVFGRVLDRVHAEFNITSRKGDISYSLKGACRGLPEHRAMRERMLSGLRAHLGVSGS